MERILHVIGSLNYGGSQSLVLSLIENMDREKIAFDFVIDRNDERKLEPIAQKYGCKVFYLPCFKGYNIISYIYHWNKFFKEHQEYRIVHGHVRSTASIYLTLAKKNGKIAIAHSHSTNSGSGIKAITKNSLQYFIRYSADYYFSCSKEAGIWLFGKKVVESDRYYEIINGINFEKYKFKKEIRERLRKENKLEDAFVIGHVGRFNEAKNHLFLVNVFNEIHKVNSKAKLVMIGELDAEEYPRVKKRVEELNISEDVIFMGPMNNIAELMNMFDCFVFPSLWEGFGIVAIEAQANGLKCYISDTIPQSVKISDNIVFASLKESPIYWSELICSSQNMRCECQTDEQYDIKIIAKKLENFYFSIL